LNGCVHDELNAAAHHVSGVTGFAVQQLERFDDVEVMLLETRHDGFDFERLEVASQARPNVGQQVCENLVRAVSSSAV
jgi:hypothetical protein